VAASRIARAGRPVFTRMLGPTPPPDEIFADFVVETFVRGLRPDVPPAQALSRRE